MRLAPAALLLLSVCLSAQVAQYRVQVTSPEELTALTALGLDVAGRPPAMDVFIRSPGEVGLLASAGFQPLRVHADVSAFYRSRLSTVPPVDMVPPFGQGSMGGYYTWSEMVQAMDSFQAAHPGIMAPRVSLGQTLMGRDIWMWKISDNPLMDEGEPEILVDGAHHAREPMSLMCAVYLAKNLVEGYGTDARITQLVDEREVYIVPLVNVDGYIHNQTTHPGGGGLWRKNRRPNGDGSTGVDPNRNYGYQWGFDNFGSSPNGSSQIYRGTAPFSEPCTQAMKQFAESRNLTLGLTMHAYGNMVFIPPGYTFSVFPPQPLRNQYELLAAEMAGFDPGYLADYPWALVGPANGTTDDWWFGSLYGGHQVWAFGAEIGSSQDGFWPATSRIIPLAEDFLEYQLFLLQVAGPHMRTDGVTVNDVGGTTSGVWEADEMLQVTASLTNLGTAPAPVTITVQTSSPWLNVLTGSVSLPAVPAFGSASNASMPLVLEVAQGAPPGAMLDFDLVVTAPGAVTRTTTLQRPLDATDVVVADDDMETDPGWTVGAPSDTATSGIWTRQDPNGSTFQLDPFNPEDDHTPDPGAACWFTGQAPPGAGAGIADVDGTTSLLSPVYDLANVRRPVISYWRWFASSADDELEVAVSNDGGRTWTVLETVGGLQNSWTFRSFVLEEHVPRSSAVQLRFRAADDPNNSICEAAVDDLRVTGFSTELTLTATGSAAPGTTLGLGLSAPAFPGTAYLMGASGSAATGIPTPYGLVPLDLDPLLMAVDQLPQVFMGFTGTLDGAGQAAPAVAVPAVPGLSGLELFLAGVLVDGGSLPAVSGALHVVVP